MEMERRSVFGAAKPDVHDDAESDDQNQDEDGYQEHESGILAFLGPKQAIRHMFADFEQAV